MNHLKKGLIAINSTIFFGSVMTIFFWLRYDYSTWLLVMTFAISTFGMLPVFLGRLLQNVLFSNSSPINGYLKSLPIILIPVFLILVFSPSHQNKILNGLIVFLIVNLGYIIDLVFTRSQGLRGIDYFIKLR